MNTIKYIKCKQECMELRHKINGYNISSFSIPMMKKGGDTIYAIESWRNALLKYLKDLENFHN